MTRLCERYVLDERGEPRLEPDLMVWAAWMEDAEARIVERTELPGGVCVSTVFLGLDHSFGQGPPVLWETMIFGGAQDENQWRYRSRKEAIEGHARAVRLASINPVP